MTKDEAIAAINNSPNAAYPSSSSYPNATLASPTQGNPKDYSSWNGDFKGYLEYLDKNGTTADHDRFIDFLMSEYSEETARKWTAEREDTQYQRLVQDLRNAGINPYSLLTNGASPISSSSSGHSYTGSYSTNESLKKEQNAQKWVSIVTSILSSAIMIALLA